MARHIIARMVYVVARIVSKPGSIDFVRAQLAGLLGPTRAEAGCLLYDLFQNTHDPTDFTFYEEWTSAAALDAHAASAHIASTFSRLDGHLAAPADVRRYSKVG
jgi:quinol monooxygenase YgiN